MTRELNHLKGANERTCRPHLLDSTHLRDSLSPHVQDSDDSSPGQQSTPPLTRRVAEAWGFPGLLGLDVDTRASHKCMQCGEISVSEVGFPLLQTVRLLPCIASIS